MNYFRTKMAIRAWAQIGVLLSLVLGWQAIVHAGHGHFEASAHAASAQVEQTGSSSKLRATLAVVEHTAYASCLLCRLGGGMLAPSGSDFLPAFDGCLHVVQSPPDVDRPASFSLGSCGPRGPPLLA